MDKFGQIIVVQDHCIVDKCTIKIAFHSKDKNMSIKLFSEQLIKISEARLLFPGNKPSERSVRRWAKNGCNGYVLESCKIENTRYTTSEAIERFIKRTNDTVTIKNNFERISDKELKLKKIKLGIY